MFIFHLKKGLIPALCYTLCAPSHLILTTVAWVRDYFAEGDAVAYRGQVASPGCAVSKCRLRLSDSMAHILNTTASK